MKNATVPNRMTRIQVQEKFKKNFQALCAKCPQLAKNHDASHTLDDSLTSLQWLWNLNVNISNPNDPHEKSKLLKQSSGLLPSFPRTTRSADATTISQLSEQPLAMPSFDATAAAESCVMSSIQSMNLANLTAHMSEKNVTLFPKSERELSTARINGNVLHTQRYARCSTLAGNSFRRLQKDQGEHSPSPCSESNTKGSDRCSEIPKVPVANLSNANEDPSSSDVSPRRHYSFSPREAMLDILPGQVDYKNNPYVKPTFSFTTLICMAMRNSKSRRLSHQGVCKWITDNFIYYRYADPSWQNSVKSILTQSKYFSKVFKKRISANCLYQLSREYELKLLDAASPLLSENASESSPRLELVSNYESDVGSLSFPSFQTLSQLDNDDAFASRKRKQASPQKLIRRRSGGAKKRRDNNDRLAESKNLLQEEAPELGSLKGDFNWNTIFNGFFGASNAELTHAPSSSSSRPSTVDSPDDGSGDAVNRFSDDVVFGSLLAHDFLILPEVPENGEQASPAELNKVSNWQSPNDCILHPPVDCKERTDACDNADLLPFQQCNINVRSPTSGHDAFKLFVEDVEDLEPNGRGLSTFPAWNPDSGDLSELLLEKPHNQGFDRVVPEEDMEHLFSSSSDNASTLFLRSV